MLLDVFTCVCMSHQMLTFALHDPKSYVWIDLLYKNNAYE